MVATLTHTSAGRLVSRPQSTFSADALQAQYHRAYAAIERKMERITEQTRIMRESRMAYRRLTGDMGAPGESPLMETAHAPTPLSGVVDIADWIARQTDIKSYRAQGEALITAYQAAAEDRARVQESLLMHIGALELPVGVSVVVGDRAVGRGDDGCVVVTDADVNAPDGILL